MKLLYVDDEDINLFLFQSTFNTEFEIFTAISGHQALEILRENDEIKTVISDMRMPKMNGLEFIKRAREQFSGIKFYLLSGFQKSPEIEKALEEQIIIRYFTKPFKSDLIRNELLNQFQHE